MIDCKVSRILNHQEALTNCVRMSREYGFNYVSINGVIYTVNSAPISTGIIELNSIMREELGVREGEIITVSPYSPTRDGLVDTEIVIVKLIPKGQFLLKEEDLVEILSRKLQQEVLSERKTYLFGLSEIFSDSTHIIYYKVKSINGMGIPSGRLNSIVNIKSLTPNIVIDNHHKLFKEIKISDLGIGGLDGEIDYIFRRAFASRTYQEETVQKLGIQHVKGIILYGPPGTGKTLISRKLSEMLNCKSLKIINGPEVLNKYVGESEKRIRELFQDAEHDQHRGTRGLHVVVFDEIDSICRERGRGSGTGTGDNIVNQLLSKMDGVEQLNNILIIGMTNRLDLIDKALLRPGRFEVKVEITLPNKEGRRHIFDIHMEKMVKNGFTRDINLDYLVELTPNFSGAEINGVIRDAVSYALNRNESRDGDQIEVLEGDFIRAIEDAQPMFGTKAIGERDLEVCVNPEEYKFNKNTFLIKGEGSERTAKSVAHYLKANNVVIINNYDLIGLDAYQKSNKIKQVVAQSLICKDSVVIFVRLEEILEYFDFNNHLNIQVAQTVRTILNRPYEEEIRFIISTDSDCLQPFFQSLNGGT